MTPSGPLSVVITVINYLLVNLIFFIGAHFCRPGHRLPCPLPRAFVGGHFTSAGYSHDSGLHTQCLYDEDCYTRNSFCKGNKICACKIGYQYDSGSDVCFPREIGLKCSEDYDCSAIRNAKCTNGKCECKFDYVASTDRSSCLPSMRLTSICEEDAQCNAVMNRSYCDPITRQCVCQRGLIQDHYRNRCVEKTKLHDRCLTTKDCETVEEYIGKVECKPTASGFISTCECAEGYEEKEDFCYKSGSSHAVLSLPAIFALFLVKWFV